MNPSKFTITIAILLAISMSVRSQWNEWTDPFPMTDSLTDNTNPSLHYTWNNNEEAVYLVWEKSIDSMSTEIWIDNILDEESAVLVLSDSGINYTHPKIMGNYWGAYGEILFYLFYQSDENGNEDIYVIPYWVEGIFGEASPLAISPEDDMQLSVSREMFYDATASIRGLASWISGGDLYACFLQYDGSYYMDEPVLVDSGACSSPSVGLDLYGVLYGKHVGNTQHIYKAQNEQGAWGMPEVYYDSLESMNPTAASYYGHPAWSVKTDSNWRIMIHVWNEYNTYDLAGPEPFDPAVLGVFLGVKAWFPEILVAVEYPDDSVNEIFMTEEMGSSNFVNFSNSGTMNRHPQFFFGEGYPYNYYCWYDYLVWESFRNGHWQIWGAKFIQCGGNIGEEELQQAFITTFPNPFTGQTTFEFTLEDDSDVIADIFDSWGKLTAHIARGQFNPGTHQLRWDAEDIEAGIYILKMTVKDRIYTSKMVKQQ